MKLRYILVIYFFVQFCANAESEEDAEESEVNHKTSDEIFNEDTNHEHPYGKPVNVLKFGEDGQFIVEEDILNQMFLHPDVKDRKIVAVSIIGAFRKGKSFLMDYALRYMYGNYKSVAYPNNALNNTSDWMGETDEPLKGFSWRGGVQRDTTGIIMWSDIFFHDVQDKKTKQVVKKLAIVLMDTQGLFDTKTSPTDNSRIFALGTLASSIQIFNLNDVILENQLEYLHLATEFSQFAMKENKKGKKRARNFKPFQNLIFLLRDWQNRQEYPYGEVGGSSYLTNVLQIRQDQPEALKNVRKFIKSSFETLECFLMPHPGTTVTSDPEYEGQRSGLAEEFEEFLMKFLDYILNPRKLIAKKILNIEVTGSEYVEYLKSYFKAFESDEIPKVETLHSITIKKQMKILVNEAFDKFKSLLINPNFNSSTFRDDMDANGNSSMAEAINSFKKKRKLGSLIDEQNNEKELKHLIIDYFNDWKHNHLKHYENMKELEEKNAKELEKAIQTANNTIIEERRRMEEILNKTKQEMNLKEEEMKKTIIELKNQSHHEILKLRREYEAQKLATKEQNDKMFIEMKKHNEEMSQRFAASQLKFQQDLIKMEFEAHQKQKETERLIEESKELKLEELRIEAEIKRKEIEQKLKIEELRQQAEIDQKSHERLIMLEQMKIRSEAEAESRRESKLMLVKLQEQQAEFQRLMLQPFTKILLKLNN